jgi:glycine/D-amino acid oxidase-like deaminating enzyme
MADIALVGAGICGLAAAELLQRFKGNSVVLIESSSQFGTGSTMDQHGWFHAGSLYSLRANMASVDAAVRNMNVMADNYGWFLNAKARGGPERALGSWFVERQLQYIFPNAPRMNDGELSPSGSALQTLRNFVELSPRIAEAEARLGSLRSMDRVLGGLKVVGADMPMKTTQILLDLAGSFIAHGGTIRFCSRYASHRRCADGAVEIGLDDGSALKVDTLVITSGQELAKMPMVSGRVTVRKSPVMVSVPTLCPDNFVLVEDEATPSLSHIVHACDGKSYSVISGGYSAAPSDGAEQERCGEALRAAAATYFPTRSRDASSRVFFGTKVDVAVSETLRDYSPGIMELDANVLAAFPGKFSFSFMLADELARRVMDGAVVPRVRHAPARIDPLLIARARHETIARAIFAASRPTPSRGLVRVHPTAQTVALYGT